MVVTGSYFLLTFVFLVYIVQQVLLSQEFVVFLWKFFSSSGWSVSMIEIGLLVSSM